MVIRNKLRESLASSWKSKIDLYLRQEGYVTYANRLEDIKFIIADVYRGAHISVAAMFPDKAEMVINPAMIDIRNFPGQQQKMMDQLSVLVRHELLHFLLVHNKRMINHLTKKDPNWQKTYRGYSIGKLSNFAADWDLSNVGYDDHDKEVVRLMSKNGKVIGGLILSDDHPEWVNLTYEELLDELIKEKEEMIDAMKQAAEQSKQDLEKNQPNDSNDEDEDEDIDELDSVPSDRSISNGSNQNDSKDDIEDSDSSNENNDDEKSTSESDDGEDLEKNSSNNSSEGEEENKDSDDSNDEDSTGGNGKNNDEDEDYDLQDKRAYADAWNEIIDRFDNNEISESELEQLIADIESGKIMEI